MPPEGGFTRVPFSRSEAGHVWKMSGASATSVSVAAPEYRTRRRGLVAETVIVALADDGASYAGTASSSMIFSVAVEGSSCASDQKPTLHRDGIQRGHAPHPPVISLPRRAMRAFEFGGYRTRAGTRVNTSILFAHRMPNIWPEPDRFDHCASPRRHRADVTNSPMPRSAAARISVSACISPTRRRNASPTISSVRARCRCRPTISHAGR